MTALTAEKNELRDLRDRVQELEELLGVVGDEVERYMTRLGLLRIEAQILGYILKREFAPRDAIYVAIYGGRPERDQPEINGVNVRMSRLRKVLRPLDVTIKNVWGKGWYMEPAEKAKLRAVLDQRAAP